MDDVYNKKVFICTDTKFPHGNAGANYVQYLGQALQAEGWEVVIIGINGSTGRKYEYHGMRCYNILLRTNKLSYRLDHMRIGKKQDEILRKEHASNKDFFIFYTYSVNQVKWFIQKNKNIPKNHVAFCCVEWFQKDQFPHGVFNWKYIRYTQLFNKYLPWSGKVLAISQKLKEHFDELGVHSIVVPIMSDPYEFEYNDCVLHNRTGKCILYSGYGYNKDSTGNIFRAISTICKKFPTIEFHTTGISCEQIKEFIDDEVLKTIGNNLVIHNWMSYEELILLYRKIDFLLLARPCNLSTLSNFPSKVPEVMNYGIIPICSDVGDYTKFYLRNDVNSIFIHGDTSEECEKAILKAITLDEETRNSMAVNARECSIEKFYYKKWGHIIDSYLQTGV